MGKKGQQDQKRLAEDLRDEVLNLRKQLQKLEEKYTERGTRREKIFNRIVRSIKHPNETILFAFVLGILYWILEANVRTFIAREGDLFHSIFTLDMDVIWLRLVVLGFLLIFGIYTRFTVIERNRAKKKLWISTKRVRDLFLTMTEGVTFINPRGEIIQANPAAERLLGLKPSTSEKHYREPSLELLRPDSTPLPSEERAVSYTHLTLPTN